MFVFIGIYNGTEQLVSINYSKAKFYVNYFLKKLGLVPTLPGN